METSPPAVPIVSRDSFVTDPFFLAARRTLEKCFVELSQKHQELKNVISCPFNPTSPIDVSGILPWYYCCCHQAVHRLHNWAPAILIPCILCHPDNQLQASAQTSNSHATQEWTQTFQDAQGVPPGQLSFTPSTFELVLDMHGFSPNEITVSVKDDNIQVSAQHEEPSQQQSTSLSVLKRYKLPCPISINHVQCSLSKEGILLVTAPWK